MARVPPRLKEIADQVKRGEPATPETVRTFISWFGAERRGYRVVWRIGKALEEVGLQTVPNFEGMHIDAKVEFHGADSAEPTESAKSSPQTIQAYGIPSDSSVSAPTISVTVSNALVVSGASADPTYRIGRLDAANRSLVWVKPDCTLTEAITYMLAHDYSQLPVMQNEREVKGIVSWKSIGSRVALGQPATTARECMEPHHEVSANDSLFSVIARIILQQYVLVRTEDRLISGIITTSDLSLQFQQLSEPFLLLAEIENHIRRLIDGKFTAQELADARDGSDPDREVSSVADLTFGEYIRLLGKPENWLRIKIGVDRAVFVKELERIRTIRNDVMHFDPDGIAVSDHETLHRFVRFLHQLQEIVGPRRGDRSAG
ncbi:MAG: HPP family protein [Burkholderiales bacterium]